MPRLPRHAAAARITLNSFGRSGAGRVALDLVSKLREIADDGDPAAALEIANIDAAIVSGDLGELQKFENGLLDLCRDKFELINGRD